MKISSVGSCVPAGRVQQKGIFAKNSQKVGKYNVVSLSEYKNAKNISFTGANDKNKEQVIFIGAESAPYSKAGGVAVVMKDYRNFGKPENQLEMIPYYGATNTKGGVFPLKDNKGNYVYKYDGNKEAKLQLVAEKTMQWGREGNVPIKLFVPTKHVMKNPDGSETEIQKDEAHLKRTYFVFVDSTAIMQKPYAEGWDYSSGAKSPTRGWKGDSYAKFSKACVELMPDAIKDKGNGFDPATVVCSDSQTGYVHEYMAQKIAKDESDNNPYKGISPTYVGHNMGPGYCGETSKRNMFVNLGATPEQIDSVIKDPLFKDLGDEYFEPFVKRTLDDFGNASAVMIPIYYTQNGYSKAFTVVAEEYAKNLAENPQAAPNIYKALSNLNKTGRFGGILNPLEDRSVDATKPLPNQRYNEDCKDTDGKIYPKFELYPADLTYDEMRKIKNANKLKFFERLQANDNTIITGHPKRTASINPEVERMPDEPVIKPELIELIKQGKGDQVPLFSSWGRIDTQKGHNITLDAFKSFAKTEEGKNAVLVLGAGLDKGEESKQVELQIKEMLLDPDLKGRVVHINGWAPAYALASASDAAIFSSRFEPCGLTDLEAMKYYCTPIVANTQGFKQKNFDPRSSDATEADNATSYKTQHEYNLLKEQVNPIIKAYAFGDKSKIEEVQKEFPVFFKTDAKGKTYYDDSIFSAFGKEYKDFITKRENALKDELDVGEGLPKGWDDWDNLSKDYAFRFGTSSDKGNFQFVRNLKDGILSAELSKALVDSVNQDKETKARMFENLHNTKTGWRNNAVLHGGNNPKSSYQLYHDLHLMPEYRAPKQEEILAKNDTEINGIIEKRQHSDMLSRISGYTLGALLGVSGYLLGKTKENVSNIPQVDDLKATINELTARLTRYEGIEQQLETATRNLAKLKKSSLNKTVFFSIAAAAAGAVIAGFAVGKIKSGTKDETCAFNTDIAPYNKKQEQTSNHTQSNVSLENFKLNLSKK